MKDMKRYLYAATVMLVLGSTVIFAAVKISEKFKVDFDSIGPIKVGMTVAEAATASGGHIVEEPVHNDEEYSECHYAEIEGLAGVFLMIVRGKIARIDVANPSVSTVAGAKVGQTEARIKLIYRNRIKVEKHPYDLKGHYMVISQPNNNRKCLMIFETEGNG